MPLFQPSTKTFSATITEIADTVGASADTEMKTRAMRSLNAAVEHFNNKAKWTFLLGEATPTTVVAPFTIALTGSSGALSATASAGHGVKPLDWINGDGFTAGTRVSATAATAVGFYTALTTAVTGATIVRDMYDLPSDYKDAYTVRLLGGNRILRQVGRRFYDRSVDNEWVTGSPEMYDLFMVGSQGKIRILPPPNGGDVMQLRYYRRMAIASSVSDAAALDIPQDYESYLVAWAKWHFLVDKGEGRLEQGKTWYSLGEQGLRIMLQDQNQRTDNDLMLVPGQFMYGNTNPDSTRFVQWDYTY